MSASWSEHEPQVGLVVAVPPGPARRQHAGHAVERVDGQTGVVGDGRQAGVREPLARLDQRVVGEGRAGLGHLVVGATSSRPSTSTSGTRGARMRRSSASFLRVAGGQQRAGSSVDVTAASASCWSAASSAQPGHREVEQRVELVAAERRALGRALHLDELARRR